MERHPELFTRGAAGESWLPEVGKNGWVPLTADKNIRCNFLEKRARQRHSIPDARKRSQWVAVFKAG
jgi:hypothetical protein